MTNMSKQTRKKMVHDLRAKTIRRKEQLIEKAIRKKQRFYPDDEECSLILASIHQNKNMFAEALLREGEEAVMLDTFTKLRQLNNYEPISQSIIKKYLHASFGEDA